MNDGRPVESGRSRSKASALCLGVRKLVTPSDRRRSVLELNKFQEASAVETLEARQHSICGFIEPRCLISTTVSLEALRQSCPYQAASVGLISQSSMQEIEKKRILIKRSSADGLLTTSADHWQIITVTRKETDRTYFTSTAHPWPEGENGRKATPYRARLSLPLQKTRHYVQADGHGFEEGTGPVPHEGRRDPVLQLLSKQI
jgi:hypothetical protein